MNITYHLIHTGVRTLLKKPRKHKKENKLLSFSKKKNSNFPSCSYLPELCFDKQKKKIENFNF